MMYVQTELCKRNIHQFAWIPAVFAKAGKYLRIGKDDGWRVVNVGAELDESHIPKHRNVFPSLMEKSKTNGGK